MAIDYTNVISLDSYALQFLDSSSEAMELYSKKKRILVDMSNIKGQWLHVDYPAIINVRKYDNNHNLCSNSEPTMAACFEFHRNNAEEFIKSNDEAYLQSYGTWQIIVSAIDENISPGGGGASGANILDEEVVDILEYDVSDGKVIVSLIDNQGNQHFTIEQNGKLIFSQPFTGTINYLLR